MNHTGSEAIFNLPLSSTLFFPLSANPVGFNHFAAAEWILRTEPRFTHVVFIPSNGHHPDPTKADAEVEPQVRLEILWLAIEAVADPDRSLLARLAGQDGETLRCGEETLLVWEGEFSQPRAVPTAECVGWLRQAHQGEDEPIHWFAGADLLERMGDAVIFSSPDLEFLAKNCRYAVLERNGRSLEETVGTLNRSREITLKSQPFAIQTAPRWLAPFFALSSTQIRNAAEAGDPLGAMLPKEAAELIVTRQLYRPGRAVARVVDPKGELISSRSALQLALESLARELGAGAGLLAERLAAHHEAGRPHTFSLVEATVGGFLTQAMAAKSGASRYFKQSRFAYDEKAKRSLLGELPSGVGAVSEEMAIQLAEAMAREAGTDFALAETGMAGPPDGKRRSMKNGICHVALTTPKGTHTACLQLPPFQSRKEHQLQFAIQALSCTREWLAADGF